MYNAIALVYRNIEEKTYAIGLYLRHGGPATRRLAELAKKAPAGPLRGSAPLPPFYGVRAAPPHVYAPREVAVQEEELRNT